MTCGRRSLSKQIQSSFDKSQLYLDKSCSCRCKSLEYFVQGMPLSFLSSKKGDEKGCVSDMAMLFNCRHLIFVQHRCRCELIAMKTGNRLPFFGMHRLEKL